MLIKKQKLIKIAKRLFTGQGLIQTLLIVVVYAALSGYYVSTNASFDETAKAAGCPIGCCGGECGDCPSGQSCDIPNGACSSGFSCNPQGSGHHKACRDNICVEIEGEGEDECTSNSQCEIDQPKVCEPNQCCGQDVKCNSKGTACNVTDTSCGKNQECWPGNCCAEGKKCDTSGKCTLPDTKCTSTPPNSTPTPIPSLTQGLSHAQVCTVRFGGSIVGGVCPADPGCGGPQQGGACCQKGATYYCCYADSSPTATDGSCYKGSSQQVVCSGKTITNNTTSPITVQKYTGCFIRQSDGKCQCSTYSGSFNLPVGQSATANCNQLEAPGYCGVSDCDNCQPTPPPKNTPTPTKKHTPTPSKTPTPTKKHTPTPTPTGTLTPTLTPTPTPTSTPTPTGTLTPSPTPTSTPTPTGTLTPTPTPTNTLTPTPTDEQYRDCYDTCDYDENCDLEYFCEEVNGTKRCVNLDCPEESDCSCDSNEDEPTPTQSEKVKGITITQYPKAGSDTYITFTLVAGAIAASLFRILLLLL